jgi:hypothetical protein
MKSPAVVFTFLLCAFWGQSQKVQAIVPAQVIVGNAFQIQYIIKDPSAFINITPPQFENLQLVSGPNYYKGTLRLNGKEEQIENITFTVVPLKPGKTRINAITATFRNEEEQKSDDIVLSVLPQPKASFNTSSTYTDINLYAPSSRTDLDKLIEANLFIKAEVDKHICFLGEAITATFKLYSRLQSTSEVLNAPSLYGFSVMDMLDINEAHQAVETIGGKVFNTSILRKLQLYPAQTGKLTVDGMQLQNTIEFKDSVTGKKVEVQKLLVSAPLEVLVKSLPSEEPQDYSGAVGQYTITAALRDPKIIAGDQGKLLVSITGKGNFLQFGPPVVNWPRRFEVFDPAVSDEINKQVVPTEGKRIYTYTFTIDDEGSYRLPPISFSFFDPRAHHFNTVSTDSLQIVVAPAKGNSFHGYQKQVFKAGKELWIYFAALIAVVVVAFVVGRRKRQPAAAATQERRLYLQEFQELLSEPLPRNQFYASVHKLLDRVSRESSLDEEQREELLAIQKDYQLIIYTGAGEGATKELLQQRTADLLKRIDS